MVQLGANNGFILVQIFNLCLIFVVLAVPGFFLRRLWLFLRSRDPLVILAQRLAHGEITQQEYYELRATLEATTAKAKRKNDEGMMSKLKNDQIMTISEEGELVPLSESTPATLKNKAERHE